MTMTRAKPKIIASARQMLRRATLMRHGLTRKRLAVAALAVLGGILIAYVAGYFWPRTVAFSYSGQTCFNNPVVLPGLTGAHNSPAFKAELRPHLSIGGLVLFSGTTCVVPLAAPEENTHDTITLAPFGNPIAKKTITITLGNAPKVTAKIAAGKPLPTKAPLEFSLDQIDGVYSYSLAANKKQVDCQRHDTTVRCDLAGLGIAQSTPYEFKLQRAFNGKQIGTVFTKTMTTVEVLGITHSTIAHSQKVYGVPSELILTLNKPVTKADGLTLESVAPDGKRQNLPATHAVREGKIIVTFTQPLPRSTAVELKIASAEAADGAYMPAGFVLPFSMSGGPQVSAISIGSARTPTNGAIVLTFDSVLGANQPYQKFIQLSTPAGPVGATVAAIGNRATITPGITLPVCTPLTIKVVDGLKSDAGVSGGSAWQFQSRTLCQTVFSIGASVQGRSILAYRFGSGPSRMVLVGAMHGNEKSSAYTLRSLIDYLESNPGQIPAQRTITIIPILNPDGYARNSRLNANNVDLNRNFPTSNWKSAVTVPGGTYAQGGGATPLSEPESRALANYTVSQSPRLVLSYHSVGPLAAANEAGDSRALATLYGQNARIPSYGNDANSNFDYDTTGAFDDWLAQKHGIPSILIELSSHTGNEFYRHRNAIMAMLRI